MGLIAVKVQWMLHRSNKFIEFSAKSLPAKTVNTKLLLICIGLSAFRMYPAEQAGLSQRQILQKLLLRIIVTRHDDGKNSGSTCVL